MKVSFKLLLAVFIATAAMTACTKEPSTEKDVVDSSVSQVDGFRTIALSFGASTKTTLGEGLKPQFSDGDKILVSNGTDTVTCTVFTENGAYISTNLEGPLTAVYPASAAKVVVEEGAKSIEDVIVLAKQDGTFAHANIAIAENISETATFNNSTTLFIVSVPEDADTTLTVTSLNIPINSEGAKLEVTVTGKDSDGKFYVSLLPGANLSDLLFESGYKSKEIPIDSIEKANASNELLAGSAYVINDKNWTGISKNSIAAMNLALKEGKTSVEMTSPTDPDTPVILPVEANGEDISVKISGVTEDEIVFKLEEGAQGPANLDISTDAQSLVINLPNSHVAVNGGDYQTVTATTSASTLVVGGDVTIGTLNINGGNAKIHGSVTTVSRASGVKVNWYADSRAKLVAGLEKSAGGDSVILSSDIDLNNEDWAPVTIGKAIVFDGNNHTVKNLKIANEYEDGHYGLIGYMYSNSVIKNLTIDGAQILPPASKGSESRGAALVGIIRSGDLENCHVKNVTVKAYQKVGGLVGQLSLEGSGTTYVKGCSATNVTISENVTGEGVWGAGGLIGSLCLENDGHSITISECSVSGISISNSTTEACPQQTAHAFIGTIRGNSDAVVTLSDNTVQQTEGLYKDEYTSDYFGWAPNEEFCGATPNCQIIINGKTWYPDYPFQNITNGINYPTLVKASAAASAGDVIHITKAGEYTVETLSLSAGCTLEATVEGVVFNHTPTTTSWVANCGDNVTVKKVTWNVGTANHQYFHGVNLDSCKVNGLLCTHSSNTYTDCEFYNGESYNFWEYGSGSTFIRCKFTCPGGAHGAGGGAVNAYNEGQQGMKTVVFDTCQFIALNKSNYYAAVYIKPETDFDILFTSCTADENFCTGAISNSKLWNVKDNSNTNTKVTVDGVVVYENGALVNPQEESQEEQQESQEQQEEQQEEENEEEKNE